MWHMMQSSNVVRNTVVGKERTNKLVWLWRKRAIRIMYFKWNKVAWKSWKRARKLVHRWTPDRSMHECDLATINLHGISSSGVVHIINKLKYVWWQKRNCKYHVLHMEQSRMEVMKTSSGISVPLDTWQKYAWMRLSHYKAKWHFVLRCRTYNK